MFNLVIFGAPGSGKGTQSEKLIDRYGLTHISTGDVLRKEIAAGSELGKIADSYISKGQLIPDDLMVDILANEVDNLRPQAKGFIFDGFPRTIPQAEALKKMLKERGEDVHSVIGLEVADEELMDRLIKRGAQSGRSDDNPETIGKRLKVYHSTTSPLRDYYTAEGTYRAIEGTGLVDEIFSRITEAIDSHPVLN
ncbi:MAG: adenylate kinase [Duncaniella sp.]|uniref:adenylate kinase n=1 Tax=Duncaniella sp. TaxID=2518496 RepID=UPI0023C7D41B|nr:adenylate kinase [Duncaniella sp.]MDE5988066.1 adenylate kinase [Duncaniella sp.]MDE6174503.1 adenylate kinase [Duncaniella sp.]